jgi:RNA polymerase sigma factor (sigma-70 family)
MQEPDDIALLHEYVERGSEDAFAALVARHVNKVYSVALLNTGNPHQAEEITQAVFVILARKSRQLGSHVILSGWLYQTARLTALTFIRSEIRRARREQEAHMQSILNESETEAFWAQIAPLLDAAMAGLNETDRHAVVLRFFDGKSMKEVGAILGATEDAAKMRVNRAVGKLQTFFARRGIDSTGDTIAQTISANSVQAAPALLAKTATAIALAKGTAASISTVTLAKATLLAMKTKTIVATAAAAVVLAGIGGYLVDTYLLHQSKPAPAPSASSTHSDTIPIQLANVDFRQDGNRDGTFLVEVDPDTLRTTNSGPAIHIKGPVAPDSSDLIQTPVAANGTYKKTDNSSSTRYFVTKTSSLYRKHIRVTCWLKTRDVRGWASAFVIIIGLDGRHLQYDDMSDRPIRGTTGWQQYEIVTDLPDEACIIYFGPDLYGPGELWSDDFQINLAPRDTPSTDDRSWRITGESDPTVYSEDTDFNVTHNGHPTVCITYTPNGTAPHGTHARWAHDFYGADSDKYSGHTVRMSGWVKTENVSERIEPVIFPYAGWYKLLAKDSMVRDSSLKGTRDWTQFSVTCVIPDDTEYLHTGFNFFGSGKVWIDTESIKLEIIK